MPEAFAILAVGFVVTVILAVGFLGNAARSPTEKLAELNQRLAWLEERARQADARGWDPQMRDNLASQLEETRGAIARIAARNES